MPFGQVLSFTSLDKILKIVISASFTSSLFISLPIRQVSGGRYLPNTKIYLSKQTNNLYLTRVTSITDDSVVSIMALPNKLNLTKLGIPTGRRQTSWLFYKRNRGVELGATVKQLQLVVRAGLEPWTSGFQVQRPNHLTTDLRPQSGPQSGRPDWSFFEPCTNVSIIDFEVKGLINTRI